MKILVLGGIKSGKSRFAEKKALALAEKKPYYLATTEFIDDEMRAKIAHHQALRADTFKSVEEPVALYETMKNLEGTILVECVSMWLNNMLFYKKDDNAIFEEITRLLVLPHNIVFVLNDVGKSVVSENALVRKFVELSGILSQKIAASCDEVYYVNAGMGTQLK